MHKNQIVFVLMETYMSIKHIGARVSVCAVNWMHLSLAFLMILAAGDPSHIKKMPAMEAGLSMEAHRSRASCGAFFRKSSSFC